MLRLASRRHTLAFLCRCLSPHEDGQALRDAVGNADWEAAIALANHFFLAPALWAGLARKGLLELVELEARAYLATMYRVNEQRNAELRTQLEEVVLLLNGAGIEPTLLKGAATLVTPDRFPGARFMLDLDLAVGDQAEAAAEALIAGGYGYKEEHPPGLDHQHLPGLFRDHAPARIELHQRMISSASLDARLFGGQATRPVTLGNGARARLLPIEEQLLLNVVHSEVSHGAHCYGYLDLRQMASFALLADGNEAALIPVESVMRSCGLGPVWAAYRHAMAMLFGLTGDKRPGIGPRSHYALRLALFDLAPRHPRLWRAWALAQRLRYSFSRSNLERRYGTPWRPVATRLRHLLHIAAKFRHADKRRATLDSIGHGLRGWSGWT